MPYNSNPTSLAGKPQNGREPIAITGIGCRLPGGVNSPESFWQLLCDEVDAIREMPPGRFDLDAYYDPEPAVPGKIVTREGGFLDDIDQFDAYFFGISPREADYVDPQQRLLLEVAWEALEDGGLVPAQLAGSRTGVFIGMWINDYEDKMYAATDDITLHMTTGGGRYAASGRLSYTFDFRGPSLTVDTACSSSLVSVHLACQAIWNGEAVMALAGGTNLILEPQISIGYSHSRMLSPDARCKFGDVRANGYVRSEGVAVIVLKPLSQALADGDAIYAVIRGSAVNNDGRSSELLVAPGVETQAEMLRQAYRSAGVVPGQVTYVEAHGTGTAVGDPVEIQALGQVLAEGRPAGQPALIGSVKTNIGHTEGTAGVAGLIKAALCLKHRAIPANLHFQQPNPTIPWAELPVQIPTAWREWPAGQPLLAGVSAFGVTGTNAHVVLAAAPDVPQPSPPTDTGRARLLPLSAHTPQALRELVEVYQEMIGRDSNLSLADLGYWTAVRRSHHAHRLAVVAEDGAELAERLQAFLQDEPGRGLVSGEAEQDHKVAFIFPGQGSQWLGMGRELLVREPVFRQTLKACEKAMRPFVDWSLLEQLALEPDDERYRLDAIDVIQPTLLSIEIALAELWRSWGVRPDAVIGHSMGEVAAAYIAGALNLEDAMRVICRRSRLLRRTSGQGAMALVELSREEAQAALRGYEDRLSVAVSNSPRATVLSGDPAALQELLDKLQQQDIFCRPVNVDVASHSPQMDPLRPELLAALAGLQPQAATIPIYSTALGEVIDGAGCDAHYWEQNLRQPVLFASMVEQLLADGHTVFIEMSPHPILLPSVQQVSQHAGRECLTVPSLRRQEAEQETLLTSMGQLYTAGYPLDWQKLYPERGRPVRLPRFPWQRERFWLAAGRPGRTVQADRPGAHPLLGQYLSSASGQHIWETRLSSEHYPYLADHQVRGSVVLPAAAFVEMALAAAREAFGEGPHVLEQLLLKEALFLEGEKAYCAQVLLTVDTPGSLSCQFYGQPADGERDAGWTLHATGRIRLHSASVEAPPVDIPAGLPTEEGAPGGSHYGAMQRRGLEYGPAFQSVQQWWRQEQSVQAALRLPAAVAGEAAGYQLHPALLDGCFQLLVALAEGDHPTATYLPTSLERIQVHHRPDLTGELWAYARRRPQGNFLVGDVYLVDGNGRVLVTAQGLEMQRLAQGETAGLADWLYTVQWEERPRPVHAAATNGSPGSWLIFADEQGVGQALAGQLVGQGERCILVQAGTGTQNGRHDVVTLDPAEPEAFQALLTAIPAGQPLRGIVHLWSLNSLTGNDVEAAQGWGCTSVLHLVQALAQADLPTPPRLWLVTRGAVFPAGEENVEDVAAGRVAQATLWGMGGVISHEHPEWRCTRLDLDPHAPAGEGEALWAEVMGAADVFEDQVALRGERRFAARLVRYVPAVPAARVPFTPTPGQGYQLAIAAPGVLDHLTLQAVPRQEPAAGEVEVQVLASGLNFLDVMKALGIYPGLDPSQPVAMGAECAGRVTAVGAGVSGFEVGDEVMVVNPSLNGRSFFSAYVTVPAQMVMLKPEGMSYVAAATLPIAYLTAYYALYHLGRIVPGERVLIHSATGGVGLAAVQLAQQAGAEIFATAGSEEKRAYLRELGVQHVMDSRSLDFAAEIMARTNGRGVDLVLNSLAGEALRQSLAVLAPYGRFLEIGKRDIYQNSPLGLAPFRKNLSFFAIDLARVLEERPELMMRLMAEVMAHVRSGALRPLPAVSFPISEAQEAFRTMAQAKHLGKIALTFPEVAAAAVDSAPTGETYLITGGLGSLGLLVAEWLVQQGARHLVLLGRSAPSPAVQERIAELEAAGAKILVARADVTQAEQLAAVLAQVEREMPPLRGVIHAAGLLADSTLLQMDQAQLWRAMAPKVLGAWNLHTLTRRANLDFFILFSSVASLLGSPGQGNYAAGNAFLDALAQARQAAGLPALSINWGPWSEVGLAAAGEHRGVRLALRGLGSLRPAQGLAALAQLKEQAVAQVAVMPFDASQWCATYPAAANSSLLREMVQEQEGGAVRGAQPAVRDIRAALLAAEPGRARHLLLLLENHLREQVAQVLRLAPARVDVHKPLKTMGLDSLMAVELRNRLENSLGVTLSATLVFNYPTITLMVPYAAGKMGISLEGDGVVETAGDSSPAPAVPDLDVSTISQLSDEDAEALLLQELEDLDF